VKAQQRWVGRCLARRRDVAPRHKAPDRETAPVRDVVVLIVIVSFFALCALYVGWCDRIIGPDDLDDEELR
jgi:hypothetical protein